MLRCALPVNALSSFIQRAAVKRPNKDQINMEEARREGKVSVQRWGQPGTWRRNKKHNHESKEVKCYINVALMNALSNAVKVVPSSETSQSESLCK